MTDEQKAKVAEYVTTFNSDIEDNDLLDLVIDTASDRILLYLNETEIAEELERVIAQIVVDVYKRTSAQSSGTGADKSVSEVSDNGQSVKYTTKPTQYLNSASDQELFTGFEKLLRNHRRPHVIT